MKIGLIIPFGSPYIGFKNLGPEFYPIRLREKKFSLGESYFVSEGDLAGRPATIVLDFSKNFWKRLFDLYLIARALRKAGAGKITAAAPHIPYSRQDRPLENGASEGFRRVAELISSSVDSFVTLDLHSALCESYFTVPLANLRPTRLFAPYLTNPDSVIVSPDLGALARAMDFGEILRLPIALFDKKRKGGKIYQEKILGSVKDKNCIIADDAIDTGATILGAADLCFRLGARSVEVCATHFLGGEKLLGRIYASGVSKVFCAYSLRPLGRPDIIPVDLLFKESIISLLN